MIIGIGHQSQTGKDLFGEMLQWKLTRPDMGFESFKLLSPEEQSQRVKIKKFASKVKEIVALIIGCSLADLEDNDFKNRSLGKDWERCVVWREEDGEIISIFSTVEEAVLNYGNYYHYRMEELTPRMLLQIVGTDAGRNLIHPNIWVNALMKDYTPDQIWIITDVRFPNEATSIRNFEGILLKMDRKFGKEISINEAINLMNQKKRVLGLNKSWEPVCIYEKRDLYLCNVLYTERTVLQHKSETSLINFTGWDMIIDNNTTLPELKRQADLVTRTFMEEFCCF